jgi:hypothetical protein
LRLGMGWVRSFVSCHRLHRCIVCTHLALLPALGMGRCSVGRARQRVHEVLVREPAAARHVARVGGSVRGACPSDGRSRSRRGRREPVQSAGRCPLQVARGRHGERAQAAAVRRREVGPLAVEEVLCTLRNLGSALGGRVRLEAAGPGAECARLKAGLGTPGGVTARAFITVRCARFVVALHLNRSPPAGVAWSALCWSFPATSLHETLSV